MNDTIKFPDEIIENLILNQSFHNKSFFTKIYNYLLSKDYKKKSYFKDQKNQIIFNILSLFYNRFKKFPSLKEFQFIINKQVEDESLRELLYSMVRKHIENVEEVNSEFIEEEALKFIKEARVYEAFFLCQNDIENNKIDLVVSRMEEAIRINFDKDLGISVKDVEKFFERLSAYDNANAIQSGLPKLDEVLNGGFFPKEIYVFSAIPGGFKTGLLGNFAINAYLQNKNVLVCTFETAAERLLGRYYQNLAKVKRNDISFNKENIKKKITENLQVNGDIMIKEYTAGTTSSNDILAYINDLILYKEWKPDLLILDYLLIMTTNDKTMTSENSYKYYKTVTEETRNIGKMLNIPVVTAAQINRSGQDEGGGSKKIITSKSLSESRGILDTADFLATLIQTKKDKDNKILSIYIDKNRNDRSGEIIKCKINYDYMSIEENRNG